MFSMAHQTRKYSRLTNFIQEVKFIYNIYKMYSIFLKYIQDIYLLFKIFKIHSRVLDMKKILNMKKKILEYEIQNLEYENKTFNI